MKLPLDFENVFTFTHQLRSKEEIELYEELSLALELMKEENFYVSASGIGGGIDFTILTPYPDGLPEKVGMMFFNINANFDVHIKEMRQISDDGYRHFQVKISKK
jgi:hypothetical protein